MSKKWCKIKKYKKTYDNHLKLLFIYVIKLSNSSLFISFAIYF